MNCGVRSPETLNSFRKYSRIFMWEYKVCKLVCRYDTWWHVGDRRSTTFSVSAGVQTSPWEFFVFSNPRKKSHYTLVNTTSTKLIFLWFHLISHSPLTLRRLLLFHNPVFFKVSVVSCFSVYIFSAPENYCLLKFLIMMLGRQHFSKTTLSYHIFSPSLQF